MAKVGSLNKLNIACRRNCAVGECYGIYKKVGVKNRLSNVDKTRTEIPSTIYHIVYSIALYLENSEIKTRWISHQVASAAYTREKYLSAKIMLCG